METSVSKAVQSGRVSGLLCSNGAGDGHILVIFNQWRSGSHSILSKYISKLLFENGACSHVLFLDRIGSGGASDNKLNDQEVKRMRIEGDFQFSSVYATAIANILAAEKLENRFFIAGSSAGANAALAAATGFKQAPHPLLAGVILVEPSAQKRHGIGQKGYGAVMHALANHVWAYRHRVRRGWWTPMDKEQYFAKGVMFEYRAHYWASDHTYKLLLSCLHDETFPPIHLVLSRDSHIHTSATREAYGKVIIGRHRLHITTGNHDKICQPPSLSVFYADAMKTLVSQ